MPRQSPSTGFVNLVPLVCDGSAIQRSTSRPSNLQQCSTKCLESLHPAGRSPHKASGLSRAQCSRGFCCPRPLQPVVGHGGACRRRSLVHEIPQKMRQGSTDLKALQHDILSVFQGRILGAFLQTQARSLAVRTRLGIPHALTFRKLVGPHRSARKMQCSFLHLSVRAPHGMNEFAERITTGVCCTCEARGYNSSRGWRAV
ncbi:hypothetical protein BKA81DRAFT_232259 [Phyllosticta paracitricarpa]|uniref:Uncharacterized protein n=1 Tax=Phyllosticta citricarpa TaxID=55181 RepID=A0ABR1MP74_9PEZI